MKNTSVLKGHAACFAAYTIFGFNIVFCRDIALSGDVSPLDMSCFRSLGAAALFWLISLFMPREKVPAKDLVKIFFAAMIGFTSAQLTFLEGMQHITSLDASIVAASCPIMTMIFAAIFQKEPITWQKTGGLALSLTGVLLLIYNTAHIGGINQTEPSGIILLLANCASFALYLALFQPLISRYSVITFMKWIFLFASVSTVPFDFNSLIHIPYATIEPKLTWQIIYVVVMATFVTYFLIPIGQKNIRPTLVSMYTYIQPIITAAFSIAMGLDIITWQKITAAVLVFTGVAVVNRSRAASHTANK